MRAFLFWPYKRGIYGDILLYLGKAFVQCFNEIGFKTKILPVKKSDPGLFQTKDLLVCVYPFGEWFHAMPGRKLYINFESLPTKSARDMMWALRHWACLKPFLRSFDAVFDYNYASVGFIRKHGFKVYYNPIGYHESFELGIGESLASGVYFLGSTNAYRQSILDACSARVIASRKDLALREAMLRTDGVHLNLTSSPWRGFDSVRIITLLLANKRCVLSEPSWDPPLTAGVHYAVANKRKIPAVCRNLMHDKVMRHELANAGYEYVKKHLHLREILRNNLKESGLLPEGAVA